MVDKLLDKPPVPGTVIDWGGLINRASAEARGEEVQPPATVAIRTVVDKSLIKPEKKKG